MIVDARLEAMDAENERLRDRISQLEDALGMDFLSPIEWRLTSSEQRVFGVLMARELATRQAIMAALYHTVGLKDEPELKIIDVFICKTRKKLSGFGIKIETRWAEGYYLAAQTKDAVRARLAQTATVQPSAPPSGSEALGPSRLTGPDEAPGTNSKSQAA